MEITGIDATTARLTTWGETTEDATTREPISGSVPEIHRFSVLDHTLFAAMLAVSALIGVYFAFFAKQKQNTTSEYLMGGKKMGIAPVSMSLISSYISAITLLGYPAEMYVYGTQLTTILIAVFGATTGCGVLFMPVFYGLQLTTSYEYLQVRFDRKVRLLGSSLYLISSFFYIPIVVYMPALAFSQVTGINIHLITPIVCLVCIFYTSLGGLKAVVWTDAVQTVVMFFATVVVVILGTISAGGIATVWQRNGDSDRLEFFNFDPDPTTRHTFWNTVFASIFGWMTHMSVNQGMVQRFLAMPTLKKAQIMVVVFTFGIVSISALSFYCGLVIYANYYDCDRLSTRIVRAPDQLLPHFVMEVSESLPGLPGLFLSGVFSAALSSMSTGLNSMSGVIYEDYIHPLLRIKVSEERASFIMKIICVLIGVFSVAMVFIVEHLGAVVQILWLLFLRTFFDLHNVSGSLSGITSGPMLAVFALGMFFPWTNSKGALAGGIVGLLVMGYTSIGAQRAIAKGQIKYTTKPVSTQGCGFLLEDIAHSAFDALIHNTTGLLGTEGILSGAMEAAEMTANTQDEEEAWYIFRISYKFYTVMGLIVTIVVGLLVSFLTGPTDPRDVHIDLLTPVVRPLFAHRCKSGDEAAHWKKKDDEGEELKNHLPEVENLLKKESIILFLNDEDKKLNNTRS